MPSFSVTLTRCFPGQEPREVLALRDGRSANKRELYVELHPRESDPLKEVNTRFFGSFGYGAEYPVRSIPQTVWKNLLTRSV